MDFKNGVMNIETMGIMAHGQYIGFVHFYV